MAKDIRDKYGREIRVATISGKQYRMLPEIKKPTRAIRGLGGKFLGRYSGTDRPDGTQYVRIIEPIDINRDGVPDLKPGQIAGRISRYPSLRPKQGQPIRVKVHASNKLSARAMKKSQKEKFKRIRRRLRK